jgi:hypothetical protein
MPEAWAPRAPESHHLDGYLLPVEDFDIHHMVWTGRLRPLGVVVGAKGHDRVMTRGRTAKGVGLGPVALALLLALVGCTALGPGSPPTPPDSAAVADGPRPSSSSPPSSPSPWPSESAVAASGPASAAVRSLTVKGRAPLTGYDRDRFGRAWADVDRNGCDTRNDVLRRDLDTVAVKPGTYGCLVRTGVLIDPYTGETIRFVRGVGTSNAVQIDHVVALADAWQKGAFRWSDARRLAFANDPLNLLAVDGPTNLQKGASDAASWLPPRKAYRCAFVARQVAVKKAYGLWITRAERDAILRVLARCPGQKLPQR